MATLTKRSEIVKAIRLLPVALEYAPRDEVMNVKGPSRCVGCNAAFLAGIIVAFTGGFALLAPIWTAPLFMAALPIAVILALLPNSSTIIRTEAARILAAFNNVGANLNRLFTDFAGEQAAATLLAAFPGASILAGKGCDNLKGLFADRASFGDAVAMSETSTRIGTKPILATFLPSERLAANLTDGPGQRNGLSIAGARTKPLSWAVHCFDGLATLFASVHVEKYSTFRPACQITVGGGIRT